MFSKKPDDPTLSELSARIGLLEQWQKGQTKNESLGGGAYPPLSGLTAGQVFAATGAAAAGFGAVGTWTPSFAGLTTPGTFTYTAGRAGRYVVIGKNCLVYGSCGISAIGTAPTGVMLVTGLPFVSAGSGVPGGVYFSFISNVKFAAGSRALHGSISLGSDVIVLYESFDNAAAAAYPAANFTNAGANMIFAGLYPLP